MQQSVLDEISNIGSTYIYYDEWRNNKTGSIADVRGNGVYRFVEVERYKSGHFKHIHENTEDDPIVIVGIVAYWLKNRRNTNRLVTMIEGKAQRNKDIKEQFDSYTQWRFEQFKTQHKDDPSSWKWDWDYEFYAKYIVPHELMLNKQTEALFEFITDDDIKQVRAVMDNYIEYLKTRRTELGYEMNPELIVLRYLQSNNVFDLEGMSKTKLNVIYTELEGKKLIKVYRLDESTPWVIRILDAGLLRIDEMENEAHSQLSEIERLRKENAELRAKLESMEENSDENVVKELTPCFYGSKEDACAFLTQIKAVNADKYKPAIAKQYLNQNKLSPLSAKGELCNILRKHKLYSKGVGNWNQLLKKA